MVFQAKQVLLNLKESDSEMDYETGRKVFLVRGYPCVHFSQLVNRKRSGL